MCGCSRRPSGLLLLLLAQLLNGLMHWSKLVSGRALSNGCDGRARACTCQHLLLCLSILHRHLRILLLRLDCSASSLEHDLLQALSQVVFEVLHCFVNRE